MSYLDNWRYREEERIRLLEQQAETERKVARGIKIFFGIGFLCIGLLLLDKHLGKTYLTKAIVIGYDFRREDWEVPTSLFSDYNGREFYQVVLSLESGDEGSFFCFSCDQTTYQIGDSDTFQVNETWLGFRRYSMKGKE